MDGDHIRGLRFQQKGKYASQNVDETFLHCNQWYAVIIIGHEPGHGDECF